MSSKQQFEALIQQKDYRTFLSEYLILGKSQNETLSSLSKRAGLSSAGFLSDVINGKKKLSVKSLGGLKKALLVPEGLEQYFEYLVFQERPELAPEHLSEGKLASAMRTLRSRLKERHSNSKPARSKQDLQEIMGSLDAHVLFAALEPNRGVSRSTLAERTGLSKAVIENGLRLFEKLKLTYEIDGMIHSHQENFENFGEEFNSSFQQTFQKALDLLSVKTSRMAEHQKDLFYYSSFLVDEASYEKMQLQLQRQLLLEMDKTLPPTGDRVAHMVFSIFLAEKSK